MQPRQRPPQPKATNVPAVLIASQPSARVRVLALRRPKPADANADGVAVVNTTSGGSDPRFSALSPFRLGPIPLYGGRVATCLENAWQAAKLYPEHADKNGEPTDAYWAWAAAIWADPVPRRFPMGRGRVPLCTLWDGERLGYIEARKRVYAPLYARAVVLTASFGHLRREYEAAQARGGHLVLLDFDGWDHVGFGVSLAEVVELEKPKMGHAFVLAALLEGSPFWAAAP
jgi:hypothetical protein